MNNKEIFTRLNMKEGQSVPEIRKAGCVFCEMAKGKQSQEFLDLYGGEQVFQLKDVSNPNHLVIVDAFPLTEGHLMLCPKDHHNSSAQLDSQEIKQHAQIIISTLQKIYPDSGIILFEHGTGITEGRKVVVCGQTCSTGNDHAHIHFLPTINPRSNQNVRVALSDVTQGMENWLKISKWIDYESSEKKSLSSTFLGSRSPEFIQDSPYVWVGIMSPEGNYEEVTYRQTSLKDEIPSQLVRRSLAPILHEREHVVSTAWNYHELAWRIFTDGFKSDIPFLQDQIALFMSKLLRSSK